MASQKSNHMKTNHISFSLWIREEVRTKQMGMYSMWVFSSEISSGCAVKDSQMHQRTMQDLRGETVWLKHHQLCSHCQLIQPLFTPQIWPLSLSKVIISLSLPLFISLCDSEVWESTYLPLKGGKFHHHLLVNMGLAVIRTK